VTGRTGEVGEPFNPDGRVAVLDRQVLDRQVDDADQPGQLNLSGDIADAAKVLAAIEVVAEKLGGTDVLVNVLDQGADAAAAVVALRARQPMGRLVIADEVAYPIACLVSPLSGSTTGTLLAVDGGMAGLLVG